MEGNVNYLNFVDFINDRFPNRSLELEEIKKSTENSDMDITKTSIDEYLNKKLMLKSESKFPEHFSAYQIEEGLKSKTLLQGVIKNYKHKLNSSQKSAIVDRSSAGKPNVIILGESFINRAVHGDLVAIQILSENDIELREVIRSSEKNVKVESLDDEFDDEIINNELDSGDQIVDSVCEPVEISHKVDYYYGKVVGIIKREWRPYVATIQLDDPNLSYHLAVPMDINIPKIRIFHSNAAEIANSRIEVVIDNWPADSQYPQGHFVRKLGKAGDIEAEIESLLVEYKIAPSLSDLTFSINVMNEMPTDTKSNPWKPNLIDTQRLDIRDKIIFSIDPIGSLDIDDAISFEVIKSPDSSSVKYELGVHIADASYFIIPGSASDLEARKRGNTIYLADRRFNMVPEILSENICSLRSGSARTLIKSVSEMSYESAQYILNTSNVFPSGEISDEFKLDKSMDSLLRPRIVEFSKAMKAIRKIRFDNGALELESTEIKFSYDKQNKIKGMKPKQKLEIHGVIEEAMIMANCAVAKKIQNYFSSSALLRIHSASIQEKFDLLKKVAELKGFIIDTTSNLTLSKSLKFIESKITSQDHFVLFLIKSITVLCLNEASYLAAGMVLSPPPNFSHYGLAVDIYTHFTSPIRRYTDIIVHRQLLEVLKIETDSSRNFEINKNDKLKPSLKGENRELYSIDDITKIADHTKYVSDLIKESDSQNGGVIYKDAVITGVYTNSIQANIPQLGLSGNIYFKKLAGHSDSNEFSENKINSSILLPLSTLTGKIEDTKIFIPGCKLDGIGNSEVRIKYPSINELIEACNTINNSNDNNMEICSKQIYETKWGELCSYIKSRSPITNSKPNIGNSTLLSGKGHGEEISGIGNTDYEYILSSRIVTLKIFDRIRIVINIQESNYRLPQMYFSLVYKSDYILSDKFVVRDNNDSSKRIGKGYNSNVKIQKANKDVSRKSECIEVDKKKTLVSRPDGNISTNDMKTLDNNKKVSNGRKSKKDKKESIYNILESFRKLKITEHTTFC
ncbi:DIS3-like exonuclease 1 [Smittium culicis]|uniref:DIS3-like exonuclease 1 n=1 Tax=Smittium culicis TaxID=133412 RepID=A0A1R1YQD9_9FUNG|nr:DIS3-like exonuclease 1 [Smittium culicis]